MSPPSYRRRTVLRLGGAALAGVATAGCLGGGSSPTVGMTADFAFDPETVTVAPGDTVTWENTDDVEHTVTAYENRLPAGTAYFASGGFDSERAARNRVNEGLLAPGDRYEHTFETPGEYAYFCVPHESSGMVGTVRVKRS